MVFHQIKMGKKRILEQLVGTKLAMQQKCLLTRLDRKFKQKNHLASVGDSGHVDIVKSLEKFILNTFQRRRRCCRRCCRRRRRRCCWWRVGKKFRFVVLRQRHHLVVGLPRRFRNRLVTSGGHVSGKIINPSFNSNFGDIFAFCELNFAGFFI